MRRTLWAILLPGLMMPAVVNASQAAPTHRAWIEAQQANDHLDAAVYLEAAHSTVLDYRLTAVREGKGGHANTRQTGSARLQAGEARRMNRLRLSVGPGDRYTLVLEVYEGDRLVAEDRLSHP